jgi:O-methyltransferase
MNPITILKAYIRQKAHKLQKTHPDRQSALHMAWGHIFNNHMRGDYWEFGVYRGDSLLISYEELQKFKRWNKEQLKSKESWRRILAISYDDYLPTFVGFDTFESMPNNSENNAQYAANTFQTNFYLVKEKLRRVPQNQLKLIKGDFTKIDLGHSDILQNEKIAILNIDSDLYVSAKSTLYLAKEKLQIGTVILFDEFHGFNADNQKGERLALREFLSETNVEVERWFDYHYGGRAFLVTNIE